MSASTPQLSPRAQLLVQLLGTHRRELQSRACTGCDWRAPAGTTNTRDPDQTRARHETFNTHLALIADAELDHLEARPFPIAHDTRRPHPPPPGPPGRPMHQHRDGTICAWVTRHGVQTWRVVDEHGNDHGSCPWLPPQ